MVVEQAEPVQVLAQDRALCLMNRKILGKKREDDRETTAGERMGRKWVGAPGWSQIRRREA